MDESMHETAGSGDKGSEEAAQGGSGFLTGLLLGLLAGAALAIIAAPQSGEDTRDILRAKAREAAERARDTAGDLTDSVSGTTSTLMERGRTIVEGARANLDDAIAEGKDAADQQRSVLENRL